MSIKAESKQIRNIILLRMPTSLKVIECSVPAGYGQRGMGNMTIRNQGKVAPRGINRDM